MNTVKTLIDRYGLGDPAAGNDIGEFSDSALQSLYDELTASGRESLASALRVGAAIEETDIIDLEKHIAQTDEPDIVRVYENLMRGPRNHLRASVFTLEHQEGESYRPQYLDQGTYDEIISASVERGNGSGRRAENEENGGGQQGQGAGNRGEQQGKAQGTRGSSGRSGSNRGGRQGGRG